MPKAMVEVFSGVKGIRAAGQRLCEGLELPERVTLVLDAPWGYALTVLPTLPPRTLVVTGNVSTHYLRDLLEYSPQGLIAANIDEHELCKALLRMASGEGFYTGPHLQETILAERERETLRLVALGLENAEIAKQLGISKQSVANIVSHLRTKLGVRNRVEMALNYLGLLSLLRSSVT
jgi:DNA-binding NarL/FixJ family response regulator